MDKMALYADRLQAALQTVFREERGQLDRAAALAATAIAADRLLHVFGTGHSHMVGEELLYRAGGLACCSAILDPPLMLHVGAEASTGKERESGYAKTVLERYTLTSGDLFFVVSNSGVNPVPVEAAQYAKEQGLTVVALVSKAYSQAAPLHPSLSVKLMDVADLVLDNHLPPGDALIPVGSGQQKAGPGSTVVAAAVFHAICLGAIERLEAQGLTAPVYISANMPGAKEHNAELVRRYKGRVYHL